MGLVPGIVRGSLTRDPGTRDILIAAHTVLRNLGQRQLMALRHRFREAAAAQQRRTDHMRPVGKLPDRRPHLGPAALAQAIVHTIAPVAHPAFRLTVAQQVYRAHASTDRPGA